MKFTKLVTEYVSFKQAMGMRYQSEVKIFRSFCKTIGDIDIEEVTPAAVEAFFAGTGSITAFWHLKYKVFNGLYRFALSRGYTDSSPLPKSIPNCPEPQKPYIYSTDELNRLLTGIDLLKFPRSPIRAATIRAIVLVLYGTGLRISEALSLKIADVNIEDSLITVHNTKFFKTRLIPIGPRLTEHLQAYLQKRRQLPRPFEENSAFFCSKTGNALTASEINKNFRLLRNIAGIHRRNGDRHSPRIHDLRHTFAVHRIESWYREGADVQRLLPKLSTYLGHLGIAETQHYLSMTPNLLREANQLFEHYVLSEVNHA